MSNHQVGSVSSQHEGKEEHWRNQRKIRRRTKRSASNTTAAIMQQEQKSRRQRPRARNRPRYPVVKQHQNNAAENQRRTQRRKLAQSNAAHRRNTTTGPITFVLPRINEQAVEAAERCEEQSNGQQRQTQFRTPRNSRDEGCSRKAETHYDLL